MRRITIKIKKHTTLVLAVSFIACVALAQTGQGRTIHVDPDAPGPYDGSSWSRAYWCLQNALKVARNGDEIRVAEGTYKPDQLFVHQGRMEPYIEASGDREATFQLVNGVTIKGGTADLKPQGNPERVDLVALAGLVQSWLNP